MDSYIEDFLQDVDALQKAGTYENRKSDLGIYQDWLDANDLEVTEISSKDLHRFFREQAQEMSDSTIRGRFDSVKLLYDFLAGEWDVMEESPVEDLKRSKYTGNGDPKKYAGDGELPRVRPDEKEMMAEHAPSPELRNELIIRLLWQTGTRRQELSDVKIDDIDREERSIRVHSSKTEKHRTVYYQPNLDFLIEQWLDAGFRDSYRPAADSPYFFVTLRSEKLSSHAINEVVKKAAENAGIQEVLYVDGGGQNRHRITAHAMRHGHAVQALKSDGITIREVQKHLGHESIDQTEKYLRLIEEDVREAFHNFSVGVEA